MLADILGFAFETEAFYSSGCISVSYNKRIAILSCADESFSSADFWKSSLALLLFIFKPTPFSYISASVNKALASPRFVALFSQ